MDDLVGLDPQPVWDSVAIYLNLTCGDLAFALLGIDLQTCPLPFSDDARRALPDSFPWRKSGHNPRIFGHPWFLNNEDVYEPHPPVRPPSSHLKGSATSKEKGKGKKSKDSSHFGPIRPLPSASASASGPYQSLPSLNAESRCFYFRRHLPEYSCYQAQSIFCCSAGSWLSISRLCQVLLVSIVMVLGSTLRVQCQKALPGWAGSTQSTSGEASFSMNLNSDALPFVNMLEYLALQT